MGGGVNVGEGEGYVDLAEAVGGLSSPFRPMGRELPLTPPSSRNSFLRTQGVIWRNRKHLTILAFL